jgi:hypothetical protein
MVRNLETLPIQAAVLETLPNSEEIDVFLRMRVRREAGTIVVAKPATR